MKYLFLILLETTCCVIRVTKDGIVEEETTECSVVGKLHPMDYYMIDSLIGTGEYDTITARNEKQALIKYLER